ncbi:ThiF family adenylyltransferase [Candidatus Kaiserbacteria bacterium]|nr:ThiF family adenylyltransferase [Candidatus Kaiserbacteria bacterium]
MDDLARLLKDAGDTQLSTLSTLFDLSKDEDRNTVTSLMASGSIRRVSDDYREQQLELFGIKNPALVYTPDFKTQFGTYFDSFGDTLRHGRWVYFPWLSALSHVLPEDDFYAVRTARNMNLITADEQKRFYSASIGIAGLSVGSSVAFAIALQGGGRHMKIADMDRLALTNTNRILSGVTELGELKVHMAARRIYEMNPYASVEVFTDGLQEESISDFFEGLDIVIDEIDNLAVKCLIREEARKRRIPVLMAADNGDNAVVDIERYDLDPETPFFHGRMGDVSYAMLRGLDKFETGRLITKLVGPENVTERMQESLMEMGKTIVSWPQLGGAAMINGAAVAYCARKVLTGESLENNRALISLDEKLIPAWGTPEESARRLNVARSFAKKFNIDL